MDAIPIEEAVLRPLLSWLLCALVPLATARLLWGILVGRLPEETSEQANALAPFRSGAFVLGIIQLQLAWMIGATALGPRFVDAPAAGANEVFGALCAITAFCAGGVGRLVEEADRSWKVTRAAIVLRLRIVPWFAGPVLTAALAARMPSVDWSGDEPVVRWGIVALALVVVALGTAFGGLVLAFATRALVIATPDVRAIAEDVARAEG
ncbi:MAG: hypothetical protein M3Y87_00145, partial [Myxococcota bacterium]|nr:hypothetical protein [Myxococcota bacterium]